MHKDECDYDSKSDNDMVIMMMLLTDEDADGMVQIMKGPVSLPD